MSRFNAKHLAFVLLGTAIASLKIYPSVFTKNGGRDTWIVMITASIFALGYLLFTVHVFEKGNFENLFSIYNRSVGGFLSIIFYILFIVNLFFTLVESSSLEASTIHTNMLDKITVSQLLFLFLIASLYVVRRGIVAVITVCLIGMVLVSISGMNLAVLTQPYKHFGYLKPFLENGIHSGMFFALLQILGIYGSLSIYFMYVPSLGDKKKIKRYMFLAMLFVIQMEIVSTLGLLTTFDVKLVNEMAYPKLLQTQLIHQIRFLEAGELFVMLQLIGGLFVKYVLGLFALIEALKHIGIKRKNVDIMISVLCFITARFITKDMFFFFEFLDAYSILSFINFIFIPFMIFNIFLLRNKSQKV